MSSLIPADYANWLNSLKEQIRATRLKANLAVNRELILLYWRLGKEIIERRASLGWGARICELTKYPLSYIFNHVR